jgi:integrase
MAEKILTDTQLRQAQAPADGKREYLLADGGSLYGRVRCTSSGEATITWQYFFKWNGKTERLSIGPYPAVTLQDARRRRDEARSGLKADPPRHPGHEARVRAEAAAAKVLAEASELTLRGLFDDWKRVYLSHNRKDKGAQVAEYFERDVFPVIGADRRARSVRRGDIVLVIDALLRRHARSSANKVLAQLKQMFSHGVVRGLVDQDPTYGFSSKHAGGKEKSRSRALSFDELAELARKLPEADLGPAYQAATLLLLATAARPGELEQAEKTEFNFNARTWLIPAEHSKNGREHLVHLTGFALEQLAILWPLSTSKWLLPSRIPDAPIARKALSKALHDRQRTVPLKGRTKAVGTLLLAHGPWTPHDMRRTFSTRAPDLGISPHIIERCLNHTMQGVMAVYNRNDYYEERRRALELWGARLQKIFAPMSAKVVPLVREAAL